VAASGWLREVAYAGVRLGACNIILVGFSVVVVRECGGVGFGGCGCEWVGSAKVVMGNDIASFFGVPRCFIFLEVV